MKKILVVGLALMFVAAACNKSAAPATQQSTSDTSTPTTVPANEVDMTSTGFSPAEITVKQGTAVTFKNVDSEPHRPASNPHPTHTDLPGFDSVNPVGPGETYTYTFVKVGTWGFHDHFNPSNHGSVIVTP